MANKDNASALHNLKADVLSYQKLIRSIRLVLGCAVLGFVFLFVLCLWGKQKEKLPAHVPNNDSQNSAVGLSYYGVDQKRHPFRVSSQKMVAQKNSTFKLEKLTSELFLYGKKAYITARTGQYIQSEHKLSDLKEVFIHTDDGYTLKSGVADVDEKSKKISGYEGVEGKGPFGFFRAGRFHMTQGGDKLILNDNPSLRFNLPA